ncbi:hypothetical protein Trichorick_01233 [Candidatus Trichorickettsia mobilis]|uniref:Excalibur calcium-binding domain-containing protein n=1 Tax=Candidatus Trichorickettsia mobilis TaxID=1346319 RepID=A0ABZ0UTF2_9RICK|nr:hypothetical protein [Candidatus Trichorickettsia mobilis]WPY01323.1 hypothetical protein Trichorick_01233 [Candidatus Trichorickettsia mobilis]
MGEENESSNNDTQNNDSAHSACAASVFEGTKTNEWESTVCTGQYSSEGDSGGGDCMIA